MLNALTERDSMTAQEARTSIQAVKTIDEARVLYSDIYSAAGTNKELQTLAWLVQQEVNDWDKHRRRNGQTAQTTELTMRNIHALPECVKETL
jgi:predicted lipid-binding transport protein (Tim44 family)